jgi:hypothetical protein
MVKLACELFTPIGEMCLTSDEYMILIISCVQHIRTESGGGGGGGCDKCQLGSFVQNAMS